MPRAADKTMFQNPQDEARGGSTTELWEVFPTLADGTYDPTGFVDVPSIFDGTTDKLPEVGDVHPNPAFGLCTGLRVSEVKSRNSVLVLVFYRSYGLFNGGPQKTSGGGGRYGEIEIPVFHVIPNTNPPLHFLDRLEKYPRPLWVRVKTVYRSGDEVDAISHAIWLNNGRYYVVGGDLYRLCGEECEVFYDGTGRTTVRYAFVTACGLPARPVGTFGNNSIPIPILPADYTYSIDKTSFTPQILTVPMFPDTVLGGPLPGLP